MTIQSTFMTTKQLVINRSDDSSTMIRHNSQEDNFLIIGMDFDMTFLRNEIETMFGENLVAEWLDGKKPEPDPGICATQKRSGR